MEDNALKTMASESDNTNNIERNFVNPSITISRFVNVVVRCACAGACMHVVLFLMLCTFLSCAIATRHPSALVLPFDFNFIAFAIFIGPKFATWKFAIIYLFAELFANPFLHSLHFFLLNFDDNNRNILFVSNSPPFFFSSLHAHILLFSNSGPLNHYTLFLSYLFLCS